MLLKILYNNTTPIVLALTYTNPMTLYKLPVVMSSHHLSYNFPNQRIQKTGQTDPISSLHLHLIHNME